MAERCVAQVRGRPAGSVASADRQSLAHCLYEAGMWAEAASAYEALEKELPRTDPTFRGLRAVAAWRAGDVATSTKIEDELRRLDRPYVRGEHLFLLALLAAQRGEKDRAVLLLREALVQGYANGVEAISFTAHRFSQFEPLRGYPPFEELVKPKG